MDQRGTRELLSAPPGTPNSCITSHRRPQRTRSYVTSRNMRTRESTSQNEDLAHCSLTRLLLLALRFNPQSEPPSHRPSLGGWKWLSGTGTGSLVLLCKIRSSFFIKGDTWDHINVSSLIKSLKQILHLRSCRNSFINPIVFKGLICSAPWHHPPVVKRLEVAVVVVGGRGWGIKHQILSYLCVGPGVLTTALFRGDAVRQKWPHNSEASIRLQQNP